jgi:hypothetical protein
VKFSLAMSRVVSGLLQTWGAQNDGFQDLGVLKHLCAEVEGHAGKVYLVNDPNLIAKHLREDLRSKKRRW